MQTTIKFKKITVISNLITVLTLFVLVYIKISKCSFIIKSSMATQAKKSFNQCRWRQVCIILFYYKLFLRIRELLSIFRPTLFPFQYLRSSMSTVGYLLAFVVSAVSHILTKIKEIVSFIITPLLKSLATPTKRLRFLLKPIALWMIFKKKYFVVARIIIIRPRVIVVLYVRPVLYCQYTYHKFRTLFTLVFSNGASF